MSALSTIRNFCIIAHIDHGKSTLADRLLEVTGTVAKRDMQEQLLDQMDIERERGITVKLAPVRMSWKGHELNLIDTPGHVDFSYEVSRSLAAVEGALLVVDASQGIQAQTLANLELARQEGLTIIPVINKIDLPNADVERVSREMVHILKIDPATILHVSAKQGTGVAEILDRVVRDVPPPEGDVTAPTRALIFDSVFDSYQGVVTYVRVIDGVFTSGQEIHFLATQSKSLSIEVGKFTPKRAQTPDIHAGQIGYIVTGLKDVRLAQVGDTITLQPQQTLALSGYKQVKPMVFAGIFPSAGEAAGHLREALEKLQLNDASLIFEPEQSPALGYGFRCGFLGLLHMDIVRERLQREYNVDVLMTVPSVAYKVYQRGKTEPLIVRSPSAMPDPASIDYIEEPMMHIRVVVPSTYIGAVMQATQDRRGVFYGLDYIENDRAVLSFDMPLASMIVDYYDTLKSVTAGFASLNYEPSQYSVADVQRMDILVAGDMVEPLSTIVYTDTSYRVGREIVESLKKVLPRQQFEVKIQAALGSKIIASEHLPAMRKDVTAGLYGGDVTRKRKVLEKQKKGKAKMKALGKVDIPQSAFLAVLKR
jgi:GTP-binding protein LepA